MPSISRHYTKLMSSSLYVVFSKRQKIEIRLVLFEFVIISCLLMYMVVLLRNAAIALMFGGFFNRLCQMCQKHIFIHLHTQWIYSMPQQLVNNIFGQRTMEYKHSV